MNLTQMTTISTTMGGVAIIVSKQFNITVIQVYDPTINAEEAEVEWFCEDLQDLLELTSKKTSFSL